MRGLLGLGTTPKIEEYAPWERTDTDANPARVVGGTSGIYPLDNIPIPGPLGTMKKDLDRMVMKLGHTLGLR